MSLFHLAALVLVVEKLLFEMTKQTANSAETDYFYFKLMCCFYRPEDIWRVTVWRPGWIVFVICSCTHTSVVTHLWRLDYTEHVIFFESQYRMKERTDQVLQTLNFHIRLSPLNWCSTGIIHMVQFKYASLKIWWRGLPTHLLHVYLLMKMNYLCRHQMAQRYRPRHIMRNKRLSHTVTTRTLKRHSERAGKVNIEVV